MRCNVNQSIYAKNCLLKYIIEPFEKEITWQWHQNLWQVPELARVIGEFGYNVDVMNYNDTAIPAEKCYDLLIDIYPVDQSVYKNNLKEDCLRIVYATGAGPSWHNRQVKQRIDNLNVRRGANLETVMHVPVSEADIETFDAMFMFGNQFTRQTFGPLNLKNVYFIRNNGYPMLPQVDAGSRSPRCFLFFASRPQVLKGLDLLLEVFARRPELTLFVCSLFKTEPGFCSLYDRELFHTPNIIPVGFVNIESELFRKITSLCCYTILPSCSEAAAGSVLTAMSAGMIPIVSRECGFDGEDVIHLEDCSIPCIEDAVCRYSAMSNEWVTREAVKAIDTIRKKYSPCHFTDSVRQAMRGLMDDQI